MRCQHTRGQEKTPDSFPPYVPPWYRTKMSPPSSKTKKFYAIHGEPTVHTKWFGKGGAGPATKGRKGIYFHGFPEKGAAEYYLSIPNSKAANQWATTHGKGKWKDHAPKIVPVADTNDLPPICRIPTPLPGAVRARLKLGVYTS